MTRQAIRGLVLFGLLTAVASSTVRAQNIPDVVTVRDRKDGSTKQHSGTYVVNATGFQVVGTDKSVTPIKNPDEVVKVVIGDLAGVERNLILAAVAKEDKKDYTGAREEYQGILKKAAGAPLRTKQYLQFKTVVNSQRLVDDLDPEKGWKEKAEAVVVEWRNYLQDYPSGWEAWSAVRASTRVQVELGKFDTAATTWNKITLNKDMPPEAKAEAQLQEIDLQIRGQKYGPAAANVGELLKAAAGARKERLVIYEIAAKANGDKKQALDAIAAIKAEMDKTKDVSVHATGFSMTGELYLVAGQPRDAMWAFLWVETVLNQDRDEAFKAISRLAMLFEKDLADEDQARKYREKLKRVRATF
jgi:hypothetical protein